MKYRPNVAAILRNDRGEILICERIDADGSWQFPQGGVDAGETPERSLARELREEISVRPKDFRVVERRGPYRYLFPEGRMKKGFRGQEQLYFLVDFIGPESRIDLATKHPEFKSFRWIQPAEFQIAWLPPMRREVYRAVFRDFFDVPLLEI